MATPDRSICDQRKLYGMPASLSPRRRAYVGSMRFAFKTAPQHTTWADMLAVWRAADDIDVFESGWTFDHFYPIFSYPPAPVWRAGQR